MADLPHPSAAATGNISGVAVVRVDTDKVGDIVGPNVLDNNVARPPVVCAVTATTVELAGVNNSEVPDGDSAASVMLNHLILGILRTTSLDERVASSEDRNSI